MEFSVIPQPAEMHLHGDRPVFRLTRLCNLHADDESRLAKEALLRFLEKPLELELVGTGKEHLFLRVDARVSSPEGYTLIVEENRVTITGHDSAGVFYGVQTLGQLLLQADGALPALEIADAPQYSYRGFLLDVSRYFFAPDAVRQLLDAMALHKLNRFHWHLTDDHGWRIELDNWPLLTQIGSMRAYTNFGRHPHGGYYTKDEIREIVQYAHDRFIQVIPEVDSPGHVVSAIASYPFLSCFNRELPVATNSGVQHDILCVGKETSFDFMFSVLDEVAELFPDGMFHIGGDEVPTMRWDNCPDCQKKMRELGFSEPKQLYAWYIGRITAHLQQKGFRVFAWHNAQLGEDIDPSVIRQHWDVLPGENADLSHVVDADYHSYYFDLPYGMVTLKNCYGQTRRAAVRCGVLFVDGVCAVDAKGGLLRVSAHGRVQRNGVDAARKKELRRVSQKAAGLFPVARRPLSPARDKTPGAALAHPQLGLSGVVLAAQSARDGTQKRARRPQGRT